MFTKEMVDKIDSFLHKNFAIIYDFKFNGLLLLWGGAIKSIIMDTPVNDLDFILLTQEEDNILDFINKYNLEYRKNGKHVYEIKYGDYFIDLSFSNDLFCNGCNTDLLLYDIYRKQIIPIGIKQAIKKRKVVVFGYNGYFSIKKIIHLKDRIKKAKKFIQFMNRDKKRVRVVKKYKYYKYAVVSFFKYCRKKLFRR